jgi:hypothetical protein
MQDHTTPYVLVLTGLAQGQACTVNLVVPPGLSPAQLLPQGIVEILLIAAAQLAHNPNEPSWAFERRAGDVYRQVGAAKANLTLVTS